VGGGAASVEHSRGGERHGSGADGGDDRAMRMKSCDVVREVAALDLKANAARRAAGPSASGDDEQVGGFFQDSVRRDSQAVGGGELIARLEGDEANVDRLLELSGTQFGGAAKNLKGGDEIDFVDALENENANVHVRLRLKLCERIHVTTGGDGVRWVTAKLGERG